MKPPLSMWLMIAVPAVSCCALPCAAAVDPLELHRAQQEVFRRAAARVAPSVVKIETVGGTQPPAVPIAVTQPSGGPRGPVASSGSGFVIADGPTTGLVYAADGLILTSAFNFVRDPAVITVTLADGRRFVAELLARDEVRRLATLKIDAADLPVPRWVERPEEIRVGQWAIALGRGFGGEDCSISVGIISGLNRQSGLAIQSDARLSPANFGGPLVDVDGRVLGLCVPMGVGTGPMAGVDWYDSGVGFAIPHAQVAVSAESLVAGHSLRRGLLGVSIDARAQEAVPIVAVADPSPARRAGLQAGDILIGLDDRPVRDYFDLRRIINTRYAGQWVKLRVRRGDSEFDAELRLAVPEDLGPIPQPDTAPSDDAEPTPAPGED